MTTSRSKTDVLSVTAKSYIKQVAKQNYFGYQNQIASRYIDKGQQQEQDSIDLINTVRMESYTKHSAAAFRTRSPSLPPWSDQQHPQAPRNLISNP